MSSTLEHDNNKYLSYCTCYIIGKIVVLDSGRDVLVVSIILEASCYSFTNCLVELKIVKGCSNHYGKKFTFISCHRFIVKYENLISCCSLCRQLR